MNFSRTYDANSSIATYRRSTDFDSLDNIYVGGLPDGAMVRKKTLSHLFQMLTRPRISSFFCSLAVRSIKSLEMRRVTVTGTRLKKKNRGIKSFLFVLLIFMYILSVPCLGKQV